MLTKQEFDYEGIPHCLERTEAEEQVTVTVCKSCMKIFERGTGWGTVCSAQCGRDLL